MSDNSTLAELGQEIVAEFSPNLIYNYFLISSAVVVLYDYLITLSQELAYTGTGKFNIPKLLFLLNRYFSLSFFYFNAFIYFVKPASNKSDRCRVFYYIEELSGIISSIGINGIFTLRTFALYGRNWIIFYFLATLAIVFMASSIWLVIIQTATALPRELQVGPNTCGFTESSSPFTGENKLFLVMIGSCRGTSASLVNNIAIAVFDALVLILTVYRTGRLARQSNNHDITGSLSIIVLRDGILYYVIIFLPTFATVSLSAVVLKTSSVKISYIADYISYVVNALSIVLTNRLVLNLSHTANTREDLEFRTRTGLDVPIFATNSVLGNIGGPVRTLSNDLCDEDPRGEAREGVDSKAADEKSRMIGDLEVQHSHSEVVGDHTIRPTSHSEFMQASERRGGRAED